MKRLQKIYYVPGIFSAILIPLVFWYLGSQKLKEPIPNVMDIGIPAKYNPKIPIEKQYSFESARNLHYKKIIVSPNSAKLNSKYYVSKIKNLQKRNKPKTGIEFILNENNSYGDFVTILNDFAIAKQEYYALDLDKTGHFFAITNYKNPNEISTIPTQIDSGVEVYSEAYYNYIHKINYRNFRNNILQLPKNVFYIIFGYLLLLNISVFSLVRKSI